MNDRKVRNCPVCESSNLEFIYQLTSVPMQNKIYETLEKALEESMLKINLYGCKNCSFVFNADFDSKSVDYSSDYDNTQEYSRYFLRYIEKLGKKLIKKYDLKNKSVLEIGCGKGGFLKILYQNGVKDIVGFDPSYVEGDQQIDKLVVKKYFSLKFCKRKFDFIICRHVLEHIPQPSRFISSCVSCLNDGGIMYFEFPSLEWIVKHRAFFDFFYEHCNYFTKKSVITLFSKFGFKNIIFNYGLDGQYFQLEISREVKRSNQKISKIRRKENNNDTDTNIFREISMFLDEEIRNWKMIIEKLNNFVIWGAGAKGVTFLTRLNITREKCRYVIDINPKKHEKFIPVTGQKIVSPQILKKEKIENIIIMNPAYEKEIISCARRYGFKGNFIILR